jgi:hypothetical protein
MIPLSPTYNSSNELSKKLTQWYSTLEHLASIPRLITLVIDGNGLVPITGSKGFTHSLPFAGIIDGWELTADVVGNAVIDVKKSTASGFPISVSVVGATPPSLVGQLNNSNYNLTDWNKEFVENERFEFVLNSVITCTRLSLTLFIVHA